MPIGGREVKLGGLFVKEKPKPSEYTDYKEFLKATYSYEKDQHATYSFTIFSQDLGLGLGNASWLIIHGKRRLTRNTAAKVIESLQLKGYEKQYFEQMVLYTHAKDSHTMDVILGKMVSLKARCVPSEKDERVLRFYSQWHHAIIFELIGLDTFFSDPSWIREKINFSLTEKEVLDSVAMLEELGLIGFDTRKNRHVKLVQDFETDAQVSALGVIQYHKKMIELGKSSIELLSSDQRDIGAVTIAVSEEGFARIKQEVQAFRRYMMFLASQYAKPTDVLQINIQAFSLTAPKAKKDTGDNNGSK
jgi:uncharacterized protein (TIGR02147 family)